ncbi:hypothetical protein Taro_022548 [Colocasia esculenta]|uniref:Deoxyhypusine synthase n=1 Tax=Colocasia esculenta TaxID=4460 RepID=A0A843V5M5_COLES|nr:hypothetical protein [Colocasia esculenta]
MVEYVAWDGYNRAVSQRTCSVPFRRTFRAGLLLLFGRRLLTSSVTLRLEQLARGPLLHPISSENVRPYRKGRIVEKALMGLDGITDGSLGDMLYFHSFLNPGLVIDIVQDIRAMNSEAVHASPRKTGIVILGGGLPKHHICNANMMRNGADYAVYINTAQEFDGSDSGAHPDEAVSWGKIRGSAKAIKIRHYAFDKQNRHWPTKTQLLAGNLSRAWGIDHRGFCLPAGKCDEKEEMDEH